MSNVLVASACGDRHHSNKHRNSANCGVCHDGENGCTVDHVHSFCHTRHVHSRHKGGTCFRKLAVVSSTVASYGEGKWVAVGTQCESLSCPCGGVFTCSGIRFKLIASNRRPCGCECFEDVDSGCSGRVCAFWSCGGVDCVCLCGAPVCAVLGETEKKEQTQDEIKGIRGDMRAMRNEMRYSNQTISRQ